ncbi:hypothetical protein G7068_13935 [Leucobacter viscericola]|uniref:DUF7507 domain-containing protein n=1 Tax=Leucobacter viscericola TaxID=2714935 RepID=A0A6G7XHY7_9MICO|nr:hypothetical protein [Leucobacter viscericola]QIK64175.1 hypothetical protein G7068_13935 [Leucobacter viscericola]
MLQNFAVSGPTKWGGVRRNTRSLLVCVLVVLLAAFGTTAAPLAAQAAVGDFEITLSAPATVGVGQNFNYTATLEFEGVNSENPATGVVLTSTLPAGVAFDSVPTDPSSPVQSYTYDPGTRLLTLTLRDTIQSVFSIVFTVTQNDRQNAFEGKQLTATMSGTGGPSGPVTSNTVTTTLTGDNDYVAGKGYDVVAGGDNRTVTYRFNVYSSHPTDGTTFTSWMQQITDTFPAGAQLVASSAAFNGGTWDTSAWPNATWTRSGAYGPDTNPIDPSSQQIWLTVFYPDTVPGWETGARPPVNTATLETADVNGATHTGAPASTQGPAFGETSGEATGAAKGDSGLTSAGGIIHYTQTIGSYTGPPGTPNADDLVLTDSGATGSPNASWFSHTDITQLYLTFSTSLASLNLPYRLEYQTNGSSTWNEFTNYVAATGRTDSVLILAVQNTGSAGWQASPAQDVLNLPLGQTLTGWRVTVAPGAETVPVGSEVRMRMGFQPVFRDVAAGIQPIDAPAAASPGPQTNTVSVDADGLSNQASSSFTPLDSVYVTTNVTTPSSISVGSNSTITAGIVNQNPSEIYADSALSVVLPCGIFYNESQPITTAGTTIGVPPVPQIGSGATVDATGRVTDTNGCSQQVVRITFDALPPMRAPGAVSNRYVENSGWRYNIPVLALAQAYDPDAPTVSTSSFATVRDPRFLSASDGGTGAVTVPMIGTDTFFGPDVHDFDPARSSVAVASGISTVNTAGGILLSKLSGPSAIGPWGLNSVVGAESFWQVFVSDVLPNPVSNVAFFDRLPSIATGDDFDTALSGPVTGAPVGATVEYSLDATSATNGTWTTNPTSAKAFRVIVPTMTSGSGFTLVVPTDNLGGFSFGETAANDVSATGTYGGSPVAFESNDARVSIGPTPSFTLVKKTNGVSYSAAPGARVATGSPVTWSYEVTNTGDTPLDDIAVQDDYVDGLGGTGTLTPTSSETGQLLPGETRTFTETGTAVVGQYSNTATATATAVELDGTVLPAQPAPETDRSWYLAGDTGLVVTKTTNGEDVDSAPGLALTPGSAVEWGYSVTNTGELPLTNVLVRDVDSAGNEVFNTTLATLAVGETATLSQQGTAVVGQYHNTVTASAQDPSEEGVQLVGADDSWYFGAVNGLTVVKQVSAAAAGPWTDAVEVTRGAKSYWRITVSNTGNAPLRDVTVEDKKLNQTIDVGTLPAGESVTKVLTQEKTQEGFTNTAVASGVAVGDVQLRASDAAKVTVTDPTPPLVPPAKGGGLAVTGAMLPAGLVSIAILLILGGWALSHRRRVSSRLGAFH